MVMETSFFISTHNQGGGTTIGHNGHWIGESPFGDLEPRVSVGAEGQLLL